MSFKVAALCTAYFPLSHADVIVTRWCDPHPADPAQGFVPSTDIASMYVMQRPAGDPPPADWFRLSPHDRLVRFDDSFDVSRSVSDQYGVPLYGSVREALCLGGDALAVDAVLLIGEHGDFPFNALQQKLYPRKELFDEVIAVFQGSGRNVPLFCDKHLSWNQDWAREMVAVVRELGVPFFAGSSLARPVSEPQVPLTLPPGAPMRESLGLYYLHPEMYGIHSLEYVQSIIERRAGGESGIAAMTAYAGEMVWEALDRGVWSRELFEHTLASAGQTRPGDYRHNCRTFGQLPPAALVIEHLDGHRSTHVMLDGHLDTFVAGVELGSGERWASPARSGASAPNLEGFVPSFARLNREIQRFFLSGVSPVPLERHLLTTLALATSMHALIERPGERLLTPHLHLPYPPRERQPSP